MHSAPDYNLDAGKVVIGVVVSVILICATSMKQLKILYGHLRSRVGRERDNSAPSSENNARVDGCTKGETLHAADTAKQLSTSVELSAA